MIIRKKELIKICDRFLCDKVSKDELIHFARTVMFDDEDRYECEGEIVEEILSQWDNKQSQHKINKTRHQASEKYTFRNERYGYSCLFRRVRCERMCFGIPFNF